MAPHRHTWVRAGVAALALLVVVGCGSPSDQEQAQERERAEQLVDATRKAGVAPRLTVDVAASLYGAEAPTVCRAFEASSTPAELVLRGNLAQGRRKVITADAVTYARLVVQTYCPDELPAFEAEVADLAPVDGDG